MRDHDFEQLIAPAVTAVLETMFFSAPLGPSDPDASMASLEARVTFSGEVSGILAVRISAASARGLAASFLGEFEERLTEARIAQVVCELTNMLCGWIVSQAGCQGCFDLSSPDLLPAGGARALGTASARESFALGNGTLTVSLYRGVPA